MSKRECDSVEVSEAKAIKIDDALAKDLEKVQDELNTLETKCREEQVEVQCKFDSLKRKHFEERGELLKKIPNFWKDVFLNFAAPNGLIVEQEVEILDHLVDIKLEDNLDKKGSHKFTLTFSENPFFKELEIVKEVQVVDDDKVNITVTPITWTKNVLEGLEEDAMQSSFMHWLQSKEEDCEGDFGSIFRENIWEDALNVYANPPEEDEVEEAEE